MFSESEDKTKLDWMYKGATSTVDREEYLLGRKIDKTLEHLNEEEKQKELGIVQPKNHVEHECIPPSIRDYKLQVGEQVDLATKLQEDPLVLIKKREEESRRQFLQNPILLKKLQATLLKRSKKKKKAKSSRGGNTSDEDIDLKIAEKLNLLKGGGSLKAQEANQDLDVILLHKLAKLKNKLSHGEIKQILECTQAAPSGTSEDDNSSDSDYKARPRTKNSHLIQHASSRRIDNNDRRRLTDEEIQHRDVSSRRNDNNERRRLIDEEKLHRDASRRGTDNVERRRLTDEEKERVRREMMENANWRDKERSRNVKRYREEDAKETKSTGDYNTDFIHKQLLKSANSSSVESRIKSNINSIQRSGNDMNTHFSKRH